MRANADELHKVVLDYYFSMDDYSYTSDPTLTFQECILIEHILTVGHKNADLAGYADPITEIDFDDLPTKPFFSESWRACIASCFRPMEITKPWNEVLIDKRINTPKCAIDSAHGYHVWGCTPPFEIIGKNRDRMMKAAYNWHFIKRGKRPKYKVEGEAYEIKR